MLVHFKEQSGTFLNIRADRRARVFLHLMLLNLRRQGSMVHYLLSAVKNNIPSTSRRTDRSRPTKALHGNFLEGIVKSVLAMSPLGRVHPDIIKIIR